MTRQRILTAAVLIPAVVSLVWLGSTALVTLAVALVTILALLEFFQITESAGLRGLAGWTALCSVGVLLIQFGATSQRVLLWGDGRSRGFFSPAAGVELDSYRLLALLLFVFVVGAGVAIFVSRRPVREALGTLSVSAAGLLFVALPLSLLVRIHGAERVGRKLLLFVLLIVWVGDTLAYFVGRAIGRHPMAPKLSPKKTWEGAVANLLGSLLVGVAFIQFLPMAPRHVLLMAALANAGGQAGDLLESAYKRSANVKESGGLLPGHGGMLDRIDAFILAAPVVWYYFVFVVQR